MSLQQERLAGGVAILVQALHLLESGVGEVLVAHVLALHGSAQPFVSEGQDIVDDDVGRESQWLVADVDVATIIERDHHVLHTVFRESSVDIPAKTHPRRLLRGGENLPGSFHLHTQTVALVEVFRQGLADGVQLAGEHQLVLVVHPVDIGSRREARTLELIARLEVAQPLRPCHGVGPVGVGHLLHEVVSHGLLVADAVRGVCLVLWGDVVGYARLRVEEVIAVVHHPASVGVHAVHHRGVLQLVTHVAVLKVQEGAEALRQQVGGLAVNVEVGFAGVVAVILEIWRERCRRRHSGHDTGLCPHDMSELASVVSVPSATEGGLQVAPVVVVGRRHHAEEVVVHLLLVHEVLLHVVCGAHAEALPRRAVELLCGLALELLVVALTLGVVQAYVGTKQPPQPLVPEQLVVLLVVVVGLVLIIGCGIALLVGGHQSAGVVGAAIEALLVLRRVVPGMVGLLLAIPGDELHHGIVAEVTTLQQIAVELRRGTVEIALRPNVRQSAL